MRKPILVMLLAAWGLCLPVHAADLAATRQSIQQVYNLLDEAASEKFLDGMLSHRTEDFQALDTHGTSIPLRVEAERMQSLLQRTLTVSESTTVLNVSAKSPTTVVAHVHDMLHAVLPGQGQDTMPVVVDTMSDDTWVQRGGQWLLRSSRVLSQKLTRETSPPKH